MPKKTATPTTPRVSKLQEYKIRATNIVRELLNPTRRGAFTTVANDLVTKKQNFVAAGELITICQTAARFNAHVELKSRGNGPEAELIIEFVDNPKSEDSAFTWE